MKKIDTGLYYPIDINNLPESWAICFIDELALDIESGFACGKHNSEGEGVIHLRPMNVTRQGKIDITDVRNVPPDFNHKRLRTNDILFNNTNSPELIGKTAHISSVQAGMAFSNHMTRVHLHDGIVPKFASLQLHYLWSTGYFSQRCVKHVNQASISTGELSKTVPLVFPSTIKQEVLVDKLEELTSEIDQGIESLKTAREQLKVYRQAVLKQAFEGKLTAKWRKENSDKLEAPDKLLERIKQEREIHYKKQVADWEREVRRWEDNDKVGKKPTKPKKLKHIDDLEPKTLKNLGSLPPEWCWAKLGYMTTAVEYGTSTKSSESGKVPVIRMGNVQDGEIDWGDLVYTSDTNEIEKYCLREGDVLFNRTNSPELVGKTALYRGQMEALFAGYLIRVNQISSVVDAEYLNYFLNSHTAKNHGNSVKTDGVNQSNINGEKLQAYPFPFCSLEEQKEVVNILNEKFDATARVLNELEAQLARSELLRQSIMNKAFSGELVAQDPDDEPASKLLERIRQDKQSNNQD